jgi:D-arabinose 1-dehydrogenase-like Zn-dependent alcohol dehydrogenase
MLIMPVMKAAQVSKPGGNFEIVEREIPEPGRGQVRIKVEACGICHSDQQVKDGTNPRIQYPRVPGHEVAGRVHAVGPEVTTWKVGQRVGVGWHGGHCFTCEYCRRGDFINCRFGKVTGISFDGGYEECMVAPTEALAAIPDELDSFEAAPLLCAGITVFNALRNSGAGPGNLIAINGIGGLGHLAVQFASRMGLRAVAIGRGGDKEPLARKLGAAAYIDSEAGNIGEALQKLGGAQIIVSTAPSVRSAPEFVDGLAPNGKLLLVGVSAEPLMVSSVQLVRGRKSVQGWASGTAKDSEDTLNFSALTGVRPMIERYPLERVAEGYEQMISGRARFRVVLTMG